MWRLAWGMILVAAIGVGAQAAAQQQEPASAQPGVIIGGSDNVSVGGRPAARSGDATDKGDALVQGSPNVFINGRPATTVGDSTACGGVTVGGSSNVFINGKPVARSGDLTSGCPQK
jgi:uncharacterized Zn-binding protein involved in type VI secretion